MLNSLHFKIKDGVNTDKNRILELFFKGWVDETCENQVQYRIERNITTDQKPGMIRYTETFRVDFDRQEDALAIKLKGIPEELKSYLEIIN